MTEAKAKAEKKNFKEKRKQSQPEMRLIFKITKRKLYMKRRKKIKMETNKKRRYRNN